MIHFFLLVLIFAGCKPDDETKKDTSDLILEIEHCGVISESETWESKYKHIITCDVSVTNELELIIEANSEIYFNKGTSLIIDNAVLKANGEATGPILMESSSSNPQAGDYVGIVATNSEINLNWLSVKHAGANNIAVDLKDSQAVIEQLTLSNSLDIGLYAQSTTFSVIAGFDAAYMKNPIVIPFSAAATLSDLVYDNVEIPYVQFSEQDLSYKASLPPQEFPYLIQALNISDTGSLTIDAGATAYLSDDITVDGSFILYGTQDQVAYLNAYSDEVKIKLSTNSIGTFRYGIIKDVIIDSSSINLYCKDSDWTATSTILNITSVKNQEAINLDGNTFTTELYGIRIPFNAINQVGSNNYESTAFNGPLVWGDITSSFAIDSKTLLVESVVNINAEVTIDNTSLFFREENLLINSVFNSSNSVYKSLESIPGSWDGIILSDEATISECEFAYASNANITVNSSGVSIENSIIHDSMGWGILQKIEANLENNTFYNNSLGDIGP